MKLTMLLLFIAVIAACGQSVLAPAVPDPPMETVVQAYEGFAHDGILELSVLDGLGHLTQSVVVTLPTAASGTSGTDVAPDDTILLHQRAVRSVDAACNACEFDDPAVPHPFQGVCVPIEAINGYARPVLDLHVQITRMTYCGAVPNGEVVTYVKADNEPGLDNTLGLWDFGNLTPSGTRNDHETVNWYFATPEPGAATCFRYHAEARGRVPSVTP